MKVPSRTVLLSAALALVLGIVGAEEDGNMKIMFRLVDECSHKPDMAVCLKLKAVTFLDRLARREEPVELTEYLALSKDASTEIEQENPKTESELEETLPRSLDEKSSVLDDLIWNKIWSLFSSRTLQFTLPTEVFEGRRGGLKLKKKGFGIVAVGAMMGAMMLKVAMAKIALIAGKALLVGKIALVISAILALKKFSGGGGGGGGGGGAEVVYATAEHAGGGGGGGWQRRYRHDPWTESSQAQNLAYSAYQADPQ